LSKAGTSGSVSEMMITDKMLATQANVGFEK
jgi:hypothetical protein